jgi:hypothetical protein
VLPLSELLAVRRCAEPSLPEGAGIWVSTQAMPTVSPLSHPAENCWDVASRGAVSCEEASVCFVICSSHSSKLLLGRAIAAASCRVPGVCTCLLCVTV